MRLRAAVSLFMLVWFFGFRYPHTEHPGVAVSTIVGPFSTKAACEREFAAVEDMFGGVIPGLQLAKCFERNSV